jgi:hypothetical protein
MPKADPSFSTANTELFNTQKELLSLCLLLARAYIGQVVPKWPPEYGVEYYLDEIGKAFEFSSLSEPSDSKMSTVQLTESGIASYILGHLKRNKPELFHPYYTAVKNYNGVAEGGLHLLQYATRTAAGGVAIGLLYRWLLPKLVERYFAQGVVVWGWVDNLYSKVKEFSLEKTAPAKAAINAAAASAQSADDAAKALNAAQKGVKGAKAAVSEAKLLERSSLVAKRFYEFNKKILGVISRGKGLGVGVRNAVAIASGARISSKIATGATLKATALGIGAATGVGIVVEIAAEVGLYYLTSLTNMVTRLLRNMQALIIVPLKKHGAEFTAGINGHQGLVYGDELGSLKELSNKLSGKDERYGGFAWTTLINLQPPLFDQKKAPERVADAELDALWAKSEGEAISLVRPAGHVNSADPTADGKFKSFPNGKDYAGLLIACQRAGTLGELLLYLFRVPM